MGHKQKSENTGLFWGFFYDEHSNPLKPQTISQFYSERNEILMMYVPSLHKRKISFFLFTLNYVKKSPYFKFVCVPFRVSSAIQQPPSNLQSGLLCIGYSSTERKQLCTFQFGSLAKKPMRKAESHTHTEQTFNLQ